MTGRQAQIQRRARALAGRVLLDDSLEVYQFRPEYQQAFSQFFDLVLYVFFDRGKFGKTVAEVNVHERLG